MKIICTGSRDHTGVRQVIAALNEALDMDGTLDILVGDCETGADLYVRNWAAMRQREGAPVRILVFKADWALWLRTSRREGGGPARNTEMVRIAAGANVTHCLAFYEPGAKNAGTADCARKADAAGIEVVPYGLADERTDQYEQEALPL